MTVTGGATIDVGDLDLPFVEPRDDATLEKRKERMRVAAADHWLVRSTFGYMVLHYDDTVAVLRDRRWHSASSMLPALMGVDDPEFVARRRTSILSAEGDEHVRLRRLVGKAFSPKAADRLRPFMRRVVDDLVDDVVEAGCCDVATAICDPYPIPIICELLGAPREDWQFFSRVAADILKVFDTNLNELLDVVMAASDELDEYTRQLIADRRSRPADDLLTALIAAEEEGDRLSTEELVMMVEAVIVAGIDTTRNQLGCAVALLCDHPDQWALLAREPDLAPRAVEEVMRYIGTVRATVRFASEDIEYRGVRFATGTFIVAGLASANADPSVFEEPTTFDITREPASKPQLTLGAGIHSCLGAALARAELQEALPLLARRMPDLAVDGPVVWKPSTTAIFGPEHLPVQFTPGTPVRSPR
ncbi:MAG: cytochrome P450 [Actinomycetota bacterium]|nr:cytochrome P450 [Actinomycetota bacterium]